MEYVLVSGPEQRTVYVDGQPSGKTNQILLIQAGTHEFSLGPPEDVTSPKKLAVVMKTTSIQPAKITLESHRR